MADRYHAEAWSLPLATSARIVARIPFIDGSFDAEISAAGRGSLKVRKDWPRLTDVVDAAGGVASLIKVFRDNTLIEEASFFARRAARALEDDAAGTVTLSGPGLGDVMNYARTENFDYPVIPTVDPDWSWGADDSVTDFKNGSFEESDHKGPPLTGGKYDNGGLVPGFEDGEMQGWERQPTTSLFLTPAVDPVVSSVISPITGALGLVWTAGLTVSGGPSLSGIRKQIRIVGSKRYTFSIAMKEPSASGDRFLFGIEHVVTAHHTNGFIENGIAWAELDNAAQGAGATDGTAQTFDLDVTFDVFDNYANVTLYLVRAEPTGSGASVTTDDYVGAGDNLGLFPWEPTDFSVVSLDQDSTPPDPFVGVHTAQVLSTATFHGIGQPIEGLTPGRTYTAVIQVRHDIGSNQEFTWRMVRTRGGATIASDVVSVPTGGGYTEMTVTAEIDVEDIFVQILKTVGSGIWFVDGAQFFAGQAAASWGDIWDQLHDDAAVDHTAEATPFERETIAFLDLTSTIALDSAGDAWAPALVSFRAKRGSKYARLLSDGGARLGFEWQVRDTATGPELDLFNPHDWSTRTGGMGSNLAGTGVPEIVYGAGVTGGPLVEEPSTANRVHIEGEAGQFAVRRDIGAIANYDTRELYEGKTDLLGLATIATAADQALEERTIPNTALKVTLDPKESDTVPIPFRDFNLGDTYPLNLIGDFTGDKRVVKISCDFTPGTGLYTVDWDQATYTSDPMKGTIEAVRRLIEAVEFLDTPADVSGLAAAVPEQPPPAGATDTYLIASRDTSRPEIVEIADAVTNEAADQAEINAAFSTTLPDGVPGTGGKNATVVLAAGRYEISGLVTVTDFATLTGTGRGSNIIPNITGLQIELETGSELAHLTFVSP